MKNICIVTTRHISYNPRVLKEADTLHSMGYRVSVVTVNNHLEQSRFDETLMRTRKWSLRTVNFRREVRGEKATWLWLSLNQRFFRLLSRYTLRFGIAERAAEKSFVRLSRLAKRQKADLYLTHHAEALGIGFRASHAEGARFGFDAEDFHSGMENMSASDYSLITFLEKKYLPRCGYLTAASDGIAKAYQEKYSLPRPTTILNVFPTEPSQQQDIHQPVRFYWYSQVIGPKRGLETLIVAAGKVREPFELHLRGSLADVEYRVQLERLAALSGCAGKVFFHPPILAEAIIADSTNYDVGLALESDVSVNRNICVTNKVFSYLMSGLALILTDTYGQKDIYTHIPSAGRLCRMNDPDDLEEAMRFYTQNTGMLAEAKKAARAAAETRFNWETESVKLLDNIRTCLA